MIPVPHWTAQHDDETVDEVDTGPYLMDEVDSSPALIDESREIVLIDLTYGATKRLVLRLSFHIHVWNDFSIINHVESSPWQKVNKNEKNSIWEIK